MKCRKCGYVSFDHNLVCPKCNRDLTTEQRALNLPDFEPNPPFLLAALTGRDSMGNQAGTPTSELTDTLVMEQVGDFPTDEEVGDELAGFPPPEQEAYELDLETEADEESDLGEQIARLESQGWGGEGEDSKETGENLAEPDGENSQEDVLDLEDLSLDEIPSPQMSGQETMLNEAEMVTVEIDKKKANLPKDVEEFKLEVDSEHSEEKAS